jgi:hypothetical protein
MTDEELNLELELDDSELMSGEHKAFMAQTRYLQEAEELSPIEPANALFEHRRARHLELLSALNALDIAELEETGREASPPVDPSSKRKAQDVVPEVRKLPDEPQRSVQSWRSSPTQPPNPDPLYRVTRNGTS